MSRAAAIAGIKAFFWGYFHALWFAVWSAFCVIVGITIGVAAAVAALEMNGIRAAREIAKMVGLP